MLDIYISRRVTKNSSLVYVAHSTLPERRKMKQHTMQEWNWVLFGHGTLMVNLRLRNSLVLAEECSENSENGIRMAS